ncbi:MAG TPA: TIR domain-containing protein [Pyrinomonadaceae bacterium]|nr:TIR domain-containing protein [Pyrinomonadaceae bacterium]
MNFFGSLLGDDIFISYSRGDGGDYVRRLDKKLTDKGYSCFTDHKGTDASEERADEGAAAAAEEPGELPPGLCRKIRAAKMLIFVGTPKAFESPRYIARELKEFTDANSTLRIVPISFDRDEQELTRWEGVAWSPYVSKKTRVREGAAALLPDGGPSDEVIEGILEVATYTKSKDRLRRYRNGALAVFLILAAAIGAGLIYGMKLDGDVRRAGEKALAAERAATERIKTADARAAEADQKASDAEAKRVLAEQASAKAQKDAEAAALATKAAEEKRRVAEQKTREAESLRRRAEDVARTQYGVAKSRETASESERLRQGGAGRIGESVKAAAESVRWAADVGAKTTEADTAVRAALAMLPALRARRRLPAAAALSPDSGTLAVEGEGRALRLLDAGNLKPLDGAQPLPLAAGRAVYAVGREGKFVAVADSNHVRILKPETGELVCEFEVKNQYLLDRPSDSQGEDVIKKIAISPDGLYVAVAANHKTGDEIDAPDETRDYRGTVTLWFIDAAGKKASRIAILGDAFDALSDVAFSPRGDVLAAAGMGGAVIWNLYNVRTRSDARAKIEARNRVLAIEGEDPDEGKEKPPESPNEYEGTTKADFDLVRSTVPLAGEVTAVAPDDATNSGFASRFATAAGRQVTVWRRGRLGAYEPSAYLPLSSPVEGLAFDGGSALAVVEGDAKSGRLYEVWSAGGYTTTANSRARGKFLSLMFNDSNALFSDSYADADEDKELVEQLWPVPPKGEEEKTVAIHSYVNNEWGPVLSDGRYVVYGGEDGKSFVRHVLTGRDVSLPDSFNEKTGSVAVISDDGSALAVLPKEEKQQELLLYGRDGDAYAQLATVKDFDRGRSLTALSSDGELLAYVNTSGRLLAQPVKGRGAPRVILSDAKRVSKLLFSPRGSYLMTFEAPSEAKGGDYSWFVYRTTDGARLGPVPSFGDETPQISGDDRLIATVSPKGAAVLIEIAGWKSRSFANSNAVEKVALSQRGDVLAAVSVGETESVVTMYDLRGNYEAARLVQRGFIKLCRFNGDGRYLAVAVASSQTWPSKYRAVVWEVSTDDLVKKAKQRLRCMAGAEEAEGCGRADTGSR